MASVMRWMTLLLYLCVPMVLANASDMDDQYKAGKVLLVTKGWLCVVCNVRTLTIHVFAAVRNKRIKAWLTGGDGSQ